MNPLITVIIPTFNRADLLPTCLNSIINQSCENWECIIVDDFSIDATHEVVHEYILKDKRFKYITNQRTKGAQGARNTGFQVSKGTFIQFLDSDDCLHYKKFELQLDLLLQNHCLEMIYCLDEYFFEKEGDCDILYKNPNILHDIDLFLFKHLTLLCPDLAFQTSSPLWRKSALLEKKLLWDESLDCWQDWDFHLKALIRGINYTSINKILNYIREHDGLRTADLDHFITEQSKLLAIENIFHELEESLCNTPLRTEYLKKSIYTILQAILCRKIKPKEDKLIKKSIDLLLKVSKSTFSKKVIYFVVYTNLIHISIQLKFLCKIFNINPLYLHFGPPKGISSIPYRI